MRSSSKPHRLYGLLGTVLLIWSGQVMADTVKWSELDANEQTVLKGFASDWDGFGEVKQRTLRRWAAKSPEERNRIRERYQEWKQLSSTQQQTIAWQLRRFKDMSAEKRARIQAWYHWVKTLPTTEQQELHLRWPSLSEMERKAYMENLRSRYGNH